MQFENLKAKIASSSEISLIYNLNAHSFEVNIKLFDSLVKSIVLYSSPIYAIRHLNELEKIQVQFHKRLLHYHNVHQVMQFNWKLEILA